MNKILILTRNQDKFLKEVQDLHLENVEIVAPDNDEGIKKHLVDATIIYGIPYLINSYIHLAEKLEWVQSTFAGIDALVSPDLRQDYVLTNVKDVYGQIMGEYVLGYILMFEKNILGNLENQKRKVWDQRAYPSVVGKIVGIMGTGSIGSEIASMLTAMGFSVIGYSESGKQKDGFEAIYSGENMKEFLSRSDYVISVLPNTTDTQGIINSQVFTDMKETGVFMNVGRGANVVETDITNALKNKKIAAAVLDVFVVEPLPEDSELWDLENLYITPHVSGYDENNGPILKILTENYDRYISGKQLHNTIDFKKGY